MWASHVERHVLNLYSVLDIEVGPGHAEARSTRPRPPSVHSLVDRWGNRQTPCVRTNGLFLTKKRSSQNAPHRRQCFSWAIEMSRHIPGRQSAEGGFLDDNTKAAIWEAKVSGQQARSATRMYPSISGRAARRGLGRHVRGCTTTQSSSKCMALRWKSPSLVFQYLHDQLRDSEWDLSIFWASNFLSICELEITSTSHGSCVKHDSDYKGIQLTAKQSSDVHYYYLNACVIIKLGVESQPRALT